MFVLFKAKFEETDSQGIKILTLQLGGTNQVIYQELEEGNRDPEGAWDWLSKKRGDLQSLWRNLTNREMFDYFTECEIVLDCEYVNVINVTVIQWSFTRTWNIQDGANSRKICQAIKHFRQSSEL